ncbi:hypothetical protein BKA62DRAFT_767507 [Auriculariales sp. MPI-PUGE-AT-0066]|nr:hypothetical protein BKA62DRAFT_767507 [Auriculariales sp. MPI-PUGE-AT-0066]
MKIAGKTVSCGIFTFSCMNLPSDISRDSNNSFFAMISPIGGDSSVTTVVSLMDPIVDMVEKWKNGKLVVTPHFPKGRLISVQVIPLIADQLASNKALGYASHSADCYCSMCTCTLDQVERLDMTAWVYRTSDAVRTQAAAWQAETINSKRDALFSQTGIRVLLFIDYYTATMFGTQSSGFFMFDQSAVVDAMELDNAEFTRRIDKELGFLHFEQANLQEEPSQARRFRCTNASVLTVDSTDSSNDSEFLPDADDGDSNSSESGTDDLVDAPNTHWRWGRREPVKPTFDAAGIAQLRQGISEIIAPSWFERPPSNIGEAKHGKLKATMWFNLVAKCMPLILLEIWSTNSNARELDLLSNLHHLVAAGNLICSFTASDETSDEYVALFTAYRESLQKLWPNSGSVPNHHYAMHLGKLMKRWGPLILLSEFPFERHIGQAEKIKSNHHYREWDYAMLRKLCHKGRLAAKLESDNQLQITDVKGETLARILQSNSCTQSTLDTGHSFTAKELNAAKQMLPDNLYNLIGQYLIERGEPVRHAAHYPHPLDAVVLPMHATPHNYIQQHGRQFSVRKMHEGNSLVRFRHRQGMGHGFIQEIWHLELQATGRTFIIIEPLEAVAENQDPFTGFPGFECRLAYDRDTQERYVIEPQQLIYHLVARRRPTGTFGIEKKTLIMCSLNQGRVPE